MKKSILFLSSTALLTSLTAYATQDTTVSADEIEATELSTVDNSPLSAENITESEEEALPAVDNISHTTVQVNSELNIPYDGKDSQTFDDNFVPGYGSAIAYKGMNDEGNPEFYALTDRGPNTDGPSIETKETEASAKFFPTPDFTPSIGILTLDSEKNEATIDEDIKIQENQQPISGLPVPDGEVGATNEVALDVNLDTLGYDGRGQDPEGIAIDVDNNIWIADEYGPFLTKLDQSGEIQEKYAPGDGLPEILQYRVPNRGFEGVTITPSGTLLAEVQSPLDIERDTAKTALFTRIVAFDPKTETSKMYGYPIDIDTYKHSKKAKIGDIYAIDDNHVLMIEQGKTKDKDDHHKIYLVDLSEATDLTDVTVNGKPLEYITDINDLPQDVKLANKQLLIDLDEAGWTADKAEGLTMLPDHQTIIVVNDNDFGIDIKAHDIENDEDLDIEDLTYFPETDEWQDEDGNTITLALSLVPNNVKSEIWLFHLDRPLLFAREATQGHIQGEEPSSTKLAHSHHHEDTLHAISKGTKTTHNSILTPSNPLSHHKEKVIPAKPLIPVQVLKSTSDFETVAADTASDNTIIARPQEIQDNALISSPTNEHVFVNNQLPQTNVSLTAPLLAILFTGIGGALTVRKRS